MGDRKKSLGGASSALAQSLAPLSRAPGEGLTVAGMPMPESVKTVTESDDRIPDRHSL